MAVTAMSRPRPVEVLGVNRTKNWNAAPRLFVDRVVQSLVARLFGDQGQTAFCNPDGTCVVGEGRWSRANCQPNPSAKLICRNTRPEMVIIVCAESLYSTLFDRLGRAVLLLPICNDASAADVAVAIKDTLSVVTQIKDFLINLPRNVLSPFIPDYNFQRLGPYTIAEDAQRDWTNFESIMRAYHEKLYDGSFRNPRRRYMVGAYKLDKRVGFQRDRLHKLDAGVGHASRENGDHLVNAYHLYGLPIIPHLRFDVNAEDNKRLGYAFTDVLTGVGSDPDRLHIDVTPDDRHSGG